MARRPMRLIQEPISAFDANLPPDSLLPVLLASDDHSRRLLRRLFSLIGYRSKRAASLLVSNGSNTELWYRWLSPTSSRLPQSRFWLRILEHLHWRRDHGFSFRNIIGFHDNGDFKTIYRMPYPEAPECVHNWGGHPAPGPLLFRWIAGEKRFASHEMPYRVSDMERRPCDVYKPSRLEWLRIGEFALWKVYGYRVQDIYGVDWSVREVMWEHGREPRSRRLLGVGAGLQLPVNPCDLLTNDIDFRI